MPDKRSRDIPGTREEFEAFLMTHYDRIYAYSYRVLGNRQDAEDLTQDICLALPGKLRDFRGSSSVVTWLYRVVVNAAIDHLRKQKTVRDSAAGWQDMLCNAADEGRERVEAIAWLSKAMSALPDDLRVTAALLVEEGLTQARVAEILGIPPGTVAWRMSRIKSCLRDMVEEDGDV
jgi:RNA polymerase sigma-70 factor (ECF subfamily)